MSWGVWRVSGGCLNDVWGFIDGAWKVNVKLRQVKLGQVKLGHVKLGQVKSGQVKSGQVKFG